MKYLITILFGTFFSLAIQAQSESGAFLTVLVDTVEFGDIKEGAEAQKEIVIKNTGNKPLIITECKGSCGCTVPTCPTTTILPGKSDLINIEYDTKGKSGHFNKTVTIKSNAVNRVVYLKVNGNVIN